MRRALRLLVAASLGATACLGGGPAPDPSVTAPPPAPAAGTTPGTAAAATCPPPRAPTYLPWRTGTVTSRVAGTASILRFDGSTLLRPRAAFVLERRADARGFPTSVTEAPTTIMGRATYVLSSRASETEFDAWWEEGTGDCRVYHARLALGGDPEEARTELVRIIASIPEQR